MTINHNLVLDMGLYIDSKNNKKINMVLNCTSETSQPEYFSTESADVNYITDHILAYIKTNISVKVPCHNKTSFTITIFNYSAYSNKAKFREMETRLNDLMIDHCKHEKSTNLFKSYCNYNKPSRLKKPIKSIVFKIIPTPTDKDYHNFRTFVEKSSISSGMDDDTKRSIIRSTQPPTAGLTMIDVFEFSRMQYGKLLYIDSMSTTDNTKINEVDIESVMKRNQTIIKNGLNGLKYGTIEEQVRINREFIDGLLSDVQGLKTVIDKQGGEIHQLRTQVDKQGSEIHQLRVEIEELKARIANIER